MKSFVKVFTISMLIATVSLCGGWKWGKKKVEEKPKSEAVEVVEPVIEQAEATPQKPAKKAVKEEVKKPAAEPVAPAEVEVEAIADANAVMVNGEAIKEAAIAKMFDKQLAQVASRMPPNMIEQYKGRIRKQVIEQMVIERILEQKIAAKNLTASDEEVQKEIDAQLVSQKLSMDDFKALLQAYGKNFDEYKENIKKKVMFDKLLTAELGETETVSEEKAKEFYDANPQQFQEPESINTRHILISIDKAQADPNKDPNQIDAEAKAKAQGVLDEIKAGGDFAELAKQYSSCPSSQKGGELGAAPKGSFVPEFEAAAYALEPNEISGLVKTQFGYHIIQLIERKEANTVAFDEAKEQIMMRLEQQQKQGAVMEYIKKVKDEADIKYANPEDKMEMPPMGQGAPRPSRQKPAPEPKSQEETSSSHKSDEEAMHEHVGGERAAEAKPQDIAPSYNADRHAGHKHAEDDDK
ncbi:MAG: peptidylprolyl isomerase [Anaerohalosphaeraceae bacterium]|nr:peptidylprolyl isomerase [Anaerohalosphaeraceae bacterium]